MITRPVGVARALVVCGMLWGVGAFVTVAAFQALGADSRIDVAGQEDRVQIVWLGAHAFSACVGSLIGIAAGGVALSSTHVTTGRLAAGLVSVPTLVAAMAVVAALVSVEMVRSDTAVAIAVGLLIGTAGAVIYVLASGRPEDELPWASTPSHETGRSWGHR